MTRKDLNVALCGVLTTAAEVSESAPLTFLFLPLQARLGWTRDEFDVMLGVIRKGELGVTTAETLTLTDKGREMARQIDAAIGGRL